MLCLVARMAAPLYFSGFGAGTSAHLKLNHQRLNHTQHGAHDVGYNRVDQWWNYDPAHGIRDYYRRNDEKRPGSRRQVCEKGPHGFLC